MATLTIPQERGLADEGRSGATLVRSVNTKKQPPPGQTYGGAISVLENGVRESRWHMIV